MSAARGNPTRFKPGLGASRYAQVAALHGRFNNPYATAWLDRATQFMAAEPPEAVGPAVVP